jgi:hypothetical protein
VECFPVRVTQTAVCAKNMGIQTVPYFPLQNIDLSSRSSTEDHEGLGFSGKLHQTHFYKIPQSSIYRERIKTVPVMQEDCVVIINIQGD